MLLSAEALANSEEDKYVPANLRQTFPLTAVVGACAQSAKPRPGDLSQAGCQHDPALRSAQRD